MHRRSFVAALLATPPLAMTTIVRACDIVLDPATPRPPTVVDGAGRWFTWAGEDTYRSLMIRVSTWESVEAATAEQDAIMRAAVPEALPQGEFYSSGLHVLPVPDVPEGYDARLHTWHSTVGVAAFVTAHAVFTVRHRSLLWDGIAVTGRPELATGLATRMIRFMEGPLPECATMIDLLPTVEDVPSGATAEDVPYDGTPFGI